MSAAAQYDALVVGGGHHGTIIACYLARAGLKVGVFERKSHFGGGATSGRGPAPDFLMNYCSHWTRFYGHPAYRDFNLQAAPSPMYCATKPPKRCTVSATHLW